MSHVDLRVLRQKGVWGTLKTLFKMRTMKHGQLIGRDSFGNEYFENRVECVVVH